MQTAGHIPCKWVVSSDANEWSSGAQFPNLQGSLIYCFSDGVMNGIINAVVDVGMTDEMPQPAFSLYQVFD